MGDHSLTHVFAKLAAADTGRECGDCVLLERFLQSRDEAAFTALVERHGPMVRGVCLRLLRNTHDADDACQATFLVLARQAASLRRHESLASWLHGVAARVAANLRRQNARRLRREEDRARRAEVVGDPNGPLRDSLAILDDELRNLPERYRAPLILCYLEGLARDEAAGRLGLTPGTLHGRLERGRNLLRRKLARRGLELSVGLLAVILEEGSVSAALAPTVVVATVRVALEIAGGCSSVSGLAPNVLSLTREVSNTMTLAKLKTASIVLLLAAVVACSGFGVLANVQLASNPTGRRSVDSPFTGKKAEFHFAANTARQDTKPAKKDKEVEPVPDKDYSLTDKEVLRLVTTPFPESRKKIYRQLSRYDGEPTESEIPHERMLMVMSTDGKTLRLVVGGSRQEHLSAVPGAPREKGWPLRETLQWSLHIMAGDVTGDAELLDKPIDADVVIRSKAGKEELAKALVGELKAKGFGEFAIGLRETEREVVVASGKHSLAKDAVVDLYADVLLKKPTSEAFYGSDSLDKVLSEFINLPVIDKSDLKTRDVTLKIAGHKPVLFGPDGIALPTAPCDPEKVLKNLEKQTGLAFKIEKRKIQTLVVEKPKPMKGE